MSTWQPMRTAPKDGRWIIAISNDRETLYRVSWGRDRNGELCWCTIYGSYGAGLFRGWIDWPDIAADVDFSAPTVWSEKST